MTKQNISLKSPEGLSFKELLYLMMNKIIRKLKKTTRFNWTLNTVFDAKSIPELTYRTFLEMRDIQNYLNYISKEIEIKKSADIGCGFGRLLPLLKEYSNEVVGFEREESLISIATKLNPNIEIIKIKDFSHLDADNDSFDLILIYTVLQHLTDEKVYALEKEITRLLKKNGYLLLCEQTDINDITGDLNSENSLLQHGRSIEEYTKIFLTFNLEKTSKRISEPTYRRDNVGSYLLFKKSYKNENQ